MTDMKRISISLSDDIDQYVLELRRTEEFCRASYAEIVRTILLRGIETIKKEENA